EGVIVLEREDAEGVAGVDRGGDEREDGSLRDAGAGDVPREPGEPGHERVPRVVELPPAVQEPLVVPVALLGALAGGGLLPRLEHGALDALERHPITPRLELAARVE